MNFIKNLSEGLKDPKKKALTKLVLYGIFFIFVFILIGSGGNNNTPTYIQEEENDTVASYEYVYKINNNEVISEVTGTLKDKEDIFNYNGLNYTKKDGIIYFNNAPILLDFDIDKYKYDKIKLLIENSDSETTYKDSKKIVYTMSAKEYFELLKETNNTVDNSEIIISLTVESDDYINHVMIDLSNYYGYKYNIEINYNNINNIEKISTN